MFEAMATQATAAATAQRGKVWVKKQGAKTNQDETSSLIMIEHSLGKEASEQLCNAVKSRINDGDRPFEIQIDSNGRPIPPISLWVDSEVQ